MRSNLNGDKTAIAIDLPPLQQIKGVDFNADIRNSDKCSLSHNPKDPYNASHIV